MSTPNSLMSSTDFAELASNFAFSSFSPARRLFDDLRRDRFVLQGCGASFYQQELLSIFMFYFDRVECLNLERFPEIEIYDCSNVSWSADM